MNIILKNENIENMLIHTASAIKGTVMEDGLVELNGKMTVELARKIITNMLKTSHTQPLEQVVLQFDVEDVPLYAELFLISSRYISPVIKSRRYVDFKDKIYKLDFYKGLTADQIDKVNIIIRNRHEDYERLIELGEKKEDARNILTLMTSTSMSFTLNIVELLKLYRETECTDNQFAKEMIHNMVMEVIAKTGVDIDITGEWFNFLDGLDIYKEIKYELFNIRLNTADDDISVFGSLKPKIRHELLDNKKVFHTLPCYDRNILRLLNINGKLHEEVDYLNGFISIAGLTHLLRHRKLITVFSNDFININSYYDISNAFKPLKYQNEKYAEIYLNHEAEIDELLSTVDDFEYARDVRAFLSLCGMKTAFITYTDAEGLIRFMNLRLCNRAQNEIASFAKYIKSTLESKGVDTSGYISSCEDLGYCPEGKFTCGKLKK